jgi:hypothetical protein
VVKHLGQRDWWLDNRHIVLMANWSRAEGMDFDAWIDLLATPWRWHTEFILAYCRETDGAVSAALKGVK